MDISLPLVDGLTATRAIRALMATIQKCRLSPLRHSANIIIKKAIDAGCNDLIDKPIDFDVLEPILNRYLAV